MPSADQVPVNSPHSTMLWPEWVVLIAGSTGSALRAVRPPNLHITPNGRRDLVHAASGKRLALLKEIIKDLSRPAILLNSDDPAVVFSLRETEKTARASGMETSLVEARSGKDLDGAFALIAKIRPEALVILPASLMTRYASQIAELALNCRMPTISYF